MLTVLVVDDSLIARKNISKMLTELDFKPIAEAKDGYEAISAFKKFAPNIITMDITMPDMDGIEAVKQIKKIDKNVKIIMCTALGQEDMILKAVKAGATGYVKKPVTIENMHKALKKAFPELNIKLPANKDEKPESANGS